MSLSGPSTCTCSQFPHVPGLSAVTVKAAAALRSGTGMVADAGVGAATRTTHARAPPLRKYCDSANDASLSDVETAELPLDVGEGQHFDRGVHRPHREAPDDRRHRRRDTGDGMHAAGDLFDVHTGVADGDGHRCSFVGLTRTLASGRAGGVPVTVVPA